VVWWPRAPVAVTSAVDTRALDRVPIVKETPEPAVAEPARVTVKPHPHPRAPAPRRAAAPVAPAPAPAPATVTGHLLVSGQGALRAEIWVDGSARGFAPKLLELPAGPHEVELRLGNGARLDKMMTLSESNTPSSPLRWMVP
jgi:hypothetical protein